MRKVVPSQEVFHLWAHQTQPTAYNSSRSVSFDGRTAYSYRAKIARHVRTDSGEGVVLFSNRKWSVTTAKHQSYCRRAIPDGVQVFNVPKLGDDWEWLQPEQVTRLHAINVADYQERAKELEGRAKRARKYRTYYEQDLAEVMREGIAYGLAFGLGATFDAGTVTALEEKVATERAARQAEQRAEQAAYDAEQRVLQADKLLKWRAGEPVDMYGYPDTLLRVESEEVVTSRGARVPLDHARRLYGLLKRGALHSGERAGVYKVDSVMPDAVQIGCHYITRAEVDLLATSQGW